MRARQGCVVGVLLMGLCLAGQMGEAHGGGEASSLPTLKQRLGSRPVETQTLGLPLQFQATHGQVDDQVKFLARGKGYTFFLTPTESVMVLSQQDTTLSIDDRYEEFIMALTFSPSQQDMNNKFGDRSATGPLLNTESAPIKQSVIRTKLEGAHSSPPVSGMEQLPGIVDYAIGSGPAK